jgi:cytochrome o ubiquinol oxidase subunit 2
VIKLRKFLFALFSVGTTLLLSSCKFAVLNPKGIIAAQEKQLLLDSVLLMLIVVIPAILLTLVFAWKYRASNTSARYSPEWSHSTLIEIIVWTVPCVIIGILAVMTWITSHTLDPYRPLDTNAKPMTIQAIALNWKWLFIYPDEKIATVNYVQIPVNRPVQFLITADAPMNSLDIPQLAGQIYAMAGMQTKLNLMANQLGDYRGQSTNISGIGFSDMKFIVRASSKEDYAQWVNKVQHSPEILTQDKYAKMVQPSINNAAEFFTVPNGDLDLYKNILMKYMMPMGDTQGMNSKLSSK